MKQHAMHTAAALLLVFCAAEAPAAPPSEPPSAAWTLSDTIDAALGYAPMLKREEAAVHAAHEAVEQAEAGYKPRLDVNASAGAGTTQIPRHE